jgi:hypothetical protein
MRCSLKRLITGLVFGAAITAGLALPEAGVAAGTHSDGSPGAPQIKDSTGDPCVALATSKARGSWTCYGDTLAYEVISSTGASSWTTESVPQANGTATPVSPLATDNDDTDCEYAGATICNVVTSTYCAWVKGNLSYGESLVVWGRFDVVWRQCFNGPWPRWRLHLIWDTGPAVDPDYFSGVARKEVSAAPDPIVSRANLYPAAIDSVHWEAWYPSSTGWQYGSAKITESGNFHDDLFGYFMANGHRFYAPTLHTGHWRSTWNSTTKIYDQKYTGKWY